MWYALIAIAAAVGFAAGGILGYGAGQKDRRAARFDPVADLKAEYRALIVGATAHESAAVKDAKAGYVSMAKSAFQQAGQLRDSADKIAKRIQRAEAMATAADNVVPFQQPEAR